jgi:predicted Rossmann-fold nucleotide-binding protein
LETTILSSDLVDARVAPKGSLEHLSQQEIAKLLDSGQGGLYPLFRKCALAVLNSGSDADDARGIFAKYKDFDLKIVRQAWGIKLEIKNAPAAAFVDGEMIRGLRDHLFAVLRDVVFISNEIMESGRFDLTSSPSITNAVFHILRNARVLEPQARPNLVVCWGGHSIRRVEYDYSKKLGYELGLRSLDVCTGCGPGAMKGPMKGAAIGHAKQRIVNGRYLGISEPGIIAAESPNPIVSQLVIMPDIEKRLEAFVRLGHGIVIFPGGAGTAEEILYLLGILLEPANQQMPFPVVFTGPADTAEYFAQIHDFIGATLGPVAQGKYQIIIDDPAGVARAMVKGLAEVRDYRRRESDSFGFNWLLKIPLEFQLPFEVTHQSMRALRLRMDQPVHERAANLRRAFSGIVAGNIKEYGVNAIERYGPFELMGEASIMQPLDQLLRSFVAQHRMKLAGAEYTPCYRLVA